MISANADFCCLSKKGAFPFWKREIRLANNMYATRTDFFYDEHYSTIKLRM